MLHQADFIAAKLVGQGAWSDRNNALKTGYDPARGAWPDWFEAVGVRGALLPQVIPAGALMGEISRQVAEGFGLSPTAVIHAGTTDSIAAFLACAPWREGAAVTSLGTTLAVKLLSPARIDAPDVGLYSHKIGDQWLVGRASNTGGGVLAHFFSPAQLEMLSGEIDPAVPSDLDYYPLLKPGERFPLNDPGLAPRMVPRPARDAAFLHGLLESIARIEARCYRTMAQMGAVMPELIYTAGGGGANPVWTAIRARVMGVRIETPHETAACVGVARLALAHK